MSAYAIWYVCNLDVQGYVLCVLIICVWHSVLRPPTITHFVLHEFKDDVGNNLAIVVTCTIKHKYKLEYLYPTVSHNDKRSIANGVASPSFMGCLLTD